MELTEHATVTSQRQISEDLIYQELSTIQGLRIAYISKRFKFLKSLKVSA